MVKQTAKTSIRLHNSADSWIGQLFHGSGEDLKAILNDSEDVKNVNKIPASIMDITFTGHSGANLVTSGHDVSGSSAEALATVIAQKCGDPKKSNLQNFYLLSCEAGLGEPSFADTFATAMHNKGFTKLKVHAICSPVSEHYIAGMIVQTQDVICDDLKIHSWCYRSSLDDIRDVAITTQIKSITSQLYNVKAKLSTRIPKEERNSLNHQVNELKITIETLEKEQENLRLYICKAVNYKEEMNQPYNTYERGVLRPKMSLDVATAIIWLREKVLSLQKEDRAEASLFTDLKRIAIKTEPEKNIDRINVIIKELQQKPGFKQDQIIDHMQKTPKPSTYNTIVDDLNDHLTSCNSRPQPTSLGIFIACWNIVMQAIIDFCKWAMNITDAPEKESLLRKSS